jgi:hypothetical protein
LCDLGSLAPHHRHSLASCRSDALITFNTLTLCSITTASRSQRMTGYANDDGDDSVGSSIREVAQQCRDALRQSHRIPGLMQYEWAENRLAEFNLWAAGAGVFAGDRASLDSRLAVESETLNLVISILILLLGSVKKCQEICRTSVLRIDPLVHSDLMINYSDDKPTG